MLQYGQGEYLYLLLLVPVLILLMYVISIWKKKAIQKFGDNKLIEKLSPSISKTKIKIKNVLFIFIITSLVIGISNPKIGTKMEEVKREGVDLMIAIDLSNSMLAEDIKPNRLKRAKQAISKLVDNLNGDRIGLIVFAGDAYVQLPITTDYSAAKLFLSTINSDIIPTQGTNIGKAINLAFSSFDKKNEQNKAIIIITDGESHDQEAIEIAASAKEKNIIIHTLGMGLEKGSPIPIYNKYGNNIGFRKDNEGNTIVSKLNEDLLKEIASSGGGSYIRANNSKAGLDALFTEINKMEKKEIGTMIFTNFKDRFQIFIAIAFILLIFNLFLNNKKFNLRFLK